ncbi:hypothetical protein [Microbacterium sp. 16-032]|uniref:hypothetical protein n=1 Tax=Microbacterium sp. 16-032 TaxID=3239808 RepID=UPI0034E2BDDA
MSTQHIAKARVVKVAVGASSGNRVARILFAGDIVPDGVAEDQIERLLERGLIEAVESGDEEVDEGAYEGVNVTELKKLISERNKGREGDTKITPAEPGNRPEIVAALLADDARQ